MNNHSVLKLRLYPVFKWSSLIIQKPNKGSCYIEFTWILGRSVANISINLTHIPQILEKGGKVITSFFREIPFVIIVCVCHTLPTFIVAISIYKCGNSLELS